MPIGGLYAIYHLVREPETTIEYRLPISPKRGLEVWLRPQSNKPSKHLSLKGGIRLEE